jgi:transcriptional regulator with AAA-type ATPase domain
LKIGADSVYPAFMLQFTMDCPFCRVRFKAGGNFNELMDQVEKHIVTEAMRQAEGNGAQAARDLGIEYYQMRHLMTKHGFLAPKKSRKKSDAG